MQAKAIEAYWTPGCSSCLRMKEFIEKSGKAFTAINVDEDPSALEKLKASGLLLPAACVGDECVNGVDLAAVASLIGVNYDPPVMLTPSELVERYNLNLSAGRRFIAQMTDAALEFQLPGRNREMLDVADQVAMVGRSFLEAYYDDRHNVAYYQKPDFVQTRQQVLDRLDETLRLVNKWWDEDGQDDPLDRVTQTYWGYPTLHEILEREVWHTTQHTRQLMYALEQLGMTPDGPLTSENLAGLPLPEGIHD
jgi:uncharacterized damage-inducible protein DinB/glutaredoxin